MKVLIADLTEMATWVNPDDDQDDLMAFENEEGDSTGESGEGDDTDSDEAIK